MNPAASDSIIIQGVDPALLSKHALWRDRNAEYLQVLSDVKKAGISLCHCEMLATSFFVRENSISGVVAGVFPWQPAGGDPASAQYRQCVVAAGEERMKFTIPESLNVNVGESISLYGAALGAFRCQLSEFAANIHDPDGSGLESLKKLLTSEVPAYALKITLGGITKEPDFAASLQIENYLQNAQQSGDMWWGQLLDGLKIASAPIG